MADVMGSPAEGVFAGGASSLKPLGDKSHGYETAPGGVWEW